MQFGLIGTQIHNGTTARITTYEALAANPVNTCLMLVHRFAVDMASYLPLYLSCCVSLSVLLFMQLWCCAVVNLDSIKPMLRTLPVASFSSTSFTVKASCSARPLRLRPHVLLQKVVCLDVYYYP
ncbi:hypothetical protein AVEN_20483-1 [Araneus ventricosus]|uniref:Uncharacterized protein n=1 Tax=Araneus ventricosus TaxID=182803 RepID=A0A4Y2RX01_ARAVE|nr:hypothetical protein AVEN_20483-1 [Araneus ventricosus]